MPVLISIGWSSETSREMIGRSCSASPRPWPNCRPKAAISSGKPNSSAFGQTAATLSVDTPGLISSIALSSHSRQSL